MIISFYKSFNIRDYRAHLFSDNNVQPPYYVLTENSIIGKRSWIVGFGFRLLSILNPDTFKFERATEDRIFRRVFSVMDTEEEAIDVLNAIHSLHPNSKNFKTALALISDKII